VKDHLDKMLEEHEQIVRRIERQHRSLFESLDADETELLEALRDPSRFDPSTWDEMVSKRRELEELIDRKIEEAREPKEKKPIPAIQGHWIHVR